MESALTTPALGALGFMLGFFYMRSMRIADSLPEKYVSKKECQDARAAYQHERDTSREELLTRLARMEDKMDRLLEGLARERN